MGAAPVKVGVLTASISRNAGGLFESVRSLALQTKETGHGVQVFSMADGFSAEDVAHWKDLPVCLLTGRGPAAFGYAPGFGAALDRTGLDLVHIHGLWMYPSVAALRWSRRWNRPVVVSPRGMLDPWAVRNSAWKKRLAGWLYEDAHLRRAACLHALCHAELEAIRSYGLANPVAVIPNGVDLPRRDDSQSPPAWVERVPQDARVLLFLGRIHPKKGLVPLLHAWQRVSTLAREAPWHLVIAGWDQGNHQAELQALAWRLGLSDRVHFVGPQFHEEKDRSFARADAFVLPSFSEGLPMAVLEAWSFGLPVWMTPGCNLPEGFAADAARKMAPDAESIASELERLFALPDEELRAMGERGHELVERRFTWPRVAAQMIEVYAWVTGRGPQPDCVVTD
ncbi:glycosyltransferase [Methylococcus capsulatus]|uniref:glycosyltransferase n=1 Tax=Methylococcus capsulatus TaxID=414 RepID=UPI002FDA8856